MDFEDLGSGDGAAAAGELEALELVQGAVIGALPAGVVAGERVEDVAVAAEIGVVGFAELAVFEAAHVGGVVVAAANEADFEGLGFGGLDAAELPEGEDEARGELELEGAGGSEVGVEVVVEVGEFGGRFEAVEDGGVGVEAVLEGVGTDGEFAGYGDGAGGEF